jgi:N-acetylmuramic acid 6-phosphate etherase
MIEPSTSEPQDCPPLDILSADELVRRMNAADATVAGAVAAQQFAIARVIDAVVARLGGGGRLLYVGAGSSGRLGVLDAAECAPTFGTDPAQVVGVIAGGPAALTQALAGAEDNEAGGRQAMDELGVGPADAVVGVTASGRTPYVLAALRRARERGVWVGGICCSAEHLLGDLADVLVAVDVGPEVLAGSTRLKAGTATKMVLNTISTGVMVRRGKTFGNWMVDLQPRNNKLRARARHIVAALTGLPEEDAQSLLDGCAGEVKTAVVAHALNLSADEARQRLDESHGGLRETLEEWGAAAACGPAHAPVWAEHAPGGLVLGVDAGGSKTVALVQTAAAAAAPPLGRGLAGPGNIAGGFQRAAAALAAAIDGARADARCGDGPFAVACLAVAGSGTAEGRLSLEQWARRQNLARDVVVVTDAAPVLACAAPEGPGVALIAGTGSIAFGQNARGETARAGGWGWLASEEGSGYGIALAALRAVAAAADRRGPDTRLTGDLLALFRVQDVRALFGALYQAGAAPARVAVLAKTVAAAAERGDRVALQLLDNAAAYLSALTATVADRLGLSSGTYPLGLTGGVLLNSPMLRDLLTTHLARRRVGVQRVVLVEQPAAGALRLAQQFLRQG